MNERPCPAPLEFDRAIDYWTGDLPPAGEASVEEHVFTCQRCARELEAVRTLAAGVAGVVREGRVHTVLTDGVLNRLAADGVRIRMFTLEGSAVIPCAVWADDDLVVSRIRADFSGVAAVTIVTRQASGEEIGRLADIPVRPGQHEILNAFSAAHLRSLPATRVEVSVSAVGTAGERSIAEYTLEHAGSFQRPSRH